MLLHLLENSGILVKYYDMPFSRSTQHRISSLTTTQINLFESRYLVLRAIVIKEVRVLVDYLDLRVNRYSLDNSVLAAHHYVLVFLLRVSD